MAKTVFSGLVILWRLADWPTSTSPVSVKATIEGVVRAPSAFSITLALLPSMIETHELVVPRSMPIALAMTCFLLRASAIAKALCGMRGLAAHKRCRTCPRGRGQRTRPGVATDQAASLTSIFLVSLRVGLGM